MSDLDLVKKLREETGLSFKVISKALAEAGNDFEKAKEILKSQASDLAAAKSTRTTKEGLIVSYVHTTGKIGALIQLGCETDFVARNDEFKNLAFQLALHASALRPSSSEEMLDQPYVKDETITVRELINQAIVKLGENIQLSAVAVLALS